MNNYYVYAYVRLDTNTYFYIGKGKNDRWKYLNNRSRYFKNILKKCDCVVEFLYENLSEYDAFLLEEKTIEDLVFNEGYSINIQGFNKSDKHLVNMTWGGEGSSGRTYKPTQETIEKIRKANKGKTPGNKGKKVSESTREKLRQNSLGNKNRLGIPCSEEAKEKLRKSHLGKSPNMTKEEKLQRAEKIKQTRLLRNNYGCSKETRDKISNTLQGKLVGSKNGMSKAIICLNDMTIFESCRQACLYYNINPANLSRALKHRNGKIGTLQFMFLNDFNANND